jgi:hypothetical protein
MFIEKLTKVKEEDKMRDKEISVILIQRTGERGERKKQFKIMDMRSNHRQ